MINTALDPKTIGHPDTIIKYTGFASKTDSCGREAELPLSKFNEVFTKHLDGEKDGPAFAPACFLGRRTKDNVSARTMVVLDIEKPKESIIDDDLESPRNDVPPNLENLHIRISDQNVRAIVHTSFSHEPENPRYRVILPLKKPHMFPGNDNLLARNAALKIDQITVKLIADDLGLLPFLDTSKTGASSIFYYPRTSKENISKADAFWTGGDFVDYNAYYSRAKDIFESLQEAEESRITLSLETGFDAIHHHEAYNDTQVPIEELRKKIGSMASLLNRFGYKQISNTGRWYPSDGEESTAGIVLNRDASGIERVYSFHANHLLSGDKLVFGRKAHDVIDVEIAHRFGITNEDFKRGFKALMGEHGITAREPKSLGRAVVDPSEEIPWPEPIDIFDDRQLPHFPVDVLNADERRYVQDIADSLGVDPGPVAIAMFATASAALDARTKLKMREKNDYHESKNMWVALIGSPASKKSPILNAVKLPLQKLQDQQNRKYNAALKQYQAEVRAGNKDVVAPTCTIYIVQDTTVEALARYLAGQDRGTTIFVDELETVFQSMNRYKKNSNDRAHFLTAYNGGTANILRVSSGVTIVDNFSFGIVGSIQPDVINKAQETEDGLIQRFLLILMDEARVGQDLDISISQKWFEDAIQDIVIRPPTIYKLQRESYTRIREVEEEGLALAKRGVSLGQGLDGWAGKLLSHLARIIIALHTLRDGSEIVKDATVLDAINILREYIIPHALFFFSKEKSLLAKRENALARYIITKKLQRFVASDIRSNVREFRTNGTERTSGDIVGPAAETLMTFGWIRPEKVEGNRDTVPKSWIVNPRVHEIHHERALIEQSERAIVHQLLRGLSKRGDS